MKQLHRKRKAIGKPQYWTQERLGLNTVLHWCCGASLELDYFASGVDAMSEQLGRFCKDHEQCFPGDYALCPNGKVEESEVA